MMSQKKKIRFHTQHTKERALQRYELDLTTKDIENIVRLIQAQKGIFVKKTTNTRTVWLVQYNQHLLKVAYNKHLKCLITCLTIDESDLKLVR